MFNDENFVKGHFPLCLAMCIHVLLNDKYAKLTRTRAQINERFTSPKTRSERRERRILSVFDGFDDNARPIGPNICQRHEHPKSRNLRTFWTALFPLRTNRFRR